MAEALYIKKGGLLYAAGTKTLIAHSALSPSRRRAHRSDRRLQGSGAHLSGHTDHRGEMERECRRVGPGHTRQASAILTDRSRRTAGKSRRANCCRRSDARIFLKPLSPALLSNRKSFCIYRHATGANRKGG